MKNYVLFLAICCCLQSQIAFSQHDFRPGFIIKNNGDSVAGFVDYRGNRRNEKICIFRETKKGQQKKFSPTEIIAYGFPGEKRYETFALKDSTFVFAEHIVSGRTSLFTYKRTFYLDYNDQTSELPKKERTKITTQTGTYEKTSYPYISWLNTQFADCGLNANNLRYEESDLTKIVQKYNACKGHEGVVFKKDKPFTKLYFNVFSGIDISQLNADKLLGDRYEKSYSPIYGITMDVSSPRINEKLFLTVELSYMKKFYQGYTETQVNTNVLDRVDYLIDVSFLKIPLGIRYNFLSDTQTPYMRFGFSQYVVFNNSLDKLTERENKLDYQVVNGLVDIDKSRTQTGLWIGVGYNKAISPKLKAFIEMRYERANGFFGGLVHPNPTSRTQTLNILAGIRF